jgi:Domain of unknown function (DUF4412)
MRPTAFPLATLLVAALASSTAIGGVYLESTASGEGKSTATVSKLWFDGGRMRSEQGGDDGAVAIFKNRTMYTVEPKTKSYRVIDQATVGQIGERMASARKEMASRLANMPPEQRAMVEKMMGKAGGGLIAQAPKRVLKNTGRAENVAGISCVIWEASVAGQKEEEICAAKSDALPGGDDVVKTLKEMGEMLKGFTESLGQIAHSAASSPWRDMETINGVPILQRDFENGKVTSETRLTAARKESVPGTQFEVPAGYTEKKINFGPGSRP